MDENDIEGCGRAVHALKSLSLNVGATRVAALSADAEEKAREHGQHPGTEAVVALRQAVADTLRALSQHQREDLSTEGRTQPTQYQR